MRTKKNNTNNEKVNKTQLNNVEGFNIDEEEFITPSFTQEKQQNMNDMIPSVEPIIDIETESAIVPNTIKTPQKCLILCMCCNDELYQKEFETIMQTWGNIISQGNTPQLDIWAYTASTNGRFEIDPVKRMIRVPVFDTLDYTYLKTQKVINSLKMFGLEYDWLLRTNCSTTINVKLLERIMESDVLDKRHIYVSDLFLNICKSSPYQYSPISKGQFFLFHKDYAGILNQECYDIAKSLCDYNRKIHPDLFSVDDLTIMAIFNTYLGLNNNDVRNVYRIMPAQYISDIVNGSDFNKNSIAFFNKNDGEQRPLKYYYYDMYDRYMDFFQKHYNELMDDLEMCRQYINEHNSFIILLIEQGQLNKYNVPFECYMSDDMFRILLS